MLNRDIDLSFIVSAYDRPKHLVCCLASLALQDGVKTQVIVTDNAENVQIQAEHKQICEEFDALYVYTGALTCYHSAEIGAQFAGGRYLAFPSDDSYFVPSFAKTMVEYADVHDLSLVYCELVYNGRWPGEAYHLLRTKAQLNSIDKTNFIVRADKFIGFPDKPNEAVACAADGLMIERLVASGIAHAKLADILAVHN